MGETLPVVSQRKVSHNIWWSRVGLGNRQIGVDSLLLEQPEGAMPGLIGPLSEALSEQIIVTTTQRLLQPPNCCGQDIQLPGLNLLNGARGKIRQFRQLLLREPGRTPLPTKILTDGF